MPEKETMRFQNGHILCCNYHECDHENFLAALNKIYSLSRLALPL
jgi:hypothetical protein